jgi:hypothetical protein
MWSLCVGCMRKLTRSSVSNVFDVMLSHRVFEVCAMCPWLGTEAW